MPDVRRVLLTGASGFLGSHFVEALLSAGYEVIAPHRGSRTPRRLEEFAPNERLALVGDLDLRVPAKVAGLLGDVRPDAVLHAAAYGVSSAERDLADAVATNVLGTSILAEEALKVGARLFVHIGTALEYGPTEGAMDEGTELVPDTLYGATKAAASVVLDFHERARGLPLVLFRPFGVFGPRESTDKLVPNAICSVLRSEPVRITSGSQVRDYLYVRDVVAAVMMAIQGEVPVGSRLNVASGKAVTVREIAELALAAVGGEAELEVGGRGAAREDRDRLVGDATKLRGLGWRPQYDLEEGLRETAAWYSRNPGLWRTP